MAPILDSMIPSRRREQKRLREEENRLRERYGDAKISAPNDGCWIYSEQTPELEWSSPSTQGFASPDLSSTVGNFGEQVIIVDTDTEPVAQTYHEEPEKNALTFTIPLPWPSRKGNTRSPSVPQAKSPSAQAPHRASPPISQSAFVYKPTSDQYMRELGDLSRGNTPVPVAAPTFRHVSPPPSVDLPLREASPMSSFSTMSSFSRRAPSPPVDHEEAHNISAIMLLSPVAEDFPSRPRASSTFSRAGSQANVSHFTRSPAPERPSLALSSHPPTDGFEVGSTVSRATGISDASYYTAITHHTTRSTARGPGLAHTGSMRSASRDRGSRRAMSTEPSRRRPMPEESVMRRQPSFDDFHYGTGSRVGRYRAESDSSDEASEVSVSQRKPSGGSTTGRSYYGSLADEYRNIAWDPSHTRAADSESLVGRVGKATKEKLRAKAVPIEPTVPGKELVPGGDDLYG